MSELRHTSIPADSLGAFCKDNHAAIHGSGTGRLADLQFAVKDAIDIVGTKTGFGHPDWLRTHPAAARTAHSVQLLLDAGADLIGKTVCDELCYSLTGDNIHYGTPVNPWDAKRYTGGSSSGSAAATAGGFVDFALGTDCGGSIRVPASYCGLLGIRPTHGRISAEGVLPFAPSFDCVGWFARNPDVFLEVGRVLLSDAAVPRPFKRLLFARDAFDLLDKELSELMGEATASQIGVIVPDQHDVQLSGNSLDSWAETFRLLQGAEIWKTLGPWINNTQPRFGPGVSERLEWASCIDAKALQRALQDRNEIKANLDSIIGPEDIVVLPSTPRPAPYKEDSDAGLETTYRQKAMSLLCSAGLAGLPQVNVPLVMFEDAPVGLSLLARRGKDIDLLGLAAKLCSSAIVT